MPLLFLAHPPGVDEASTIKCSIPQRSGSLRTMPLTLSINSLLALR
jgi:hypothetical protein